jgi:hypothetical protein
METSEYPYGISNLRIFVRAERPLALERSIDKGMKPGFRHRGARRTFAVESKPGRILSPSSKIARYDR